MTRLGFLLDDADAGERAARCRELRALALLLLGRQHAVTLALGRAIADPAAAGSALAAIAALPPLPRRRLLAALAALMREAA